MHYAEKTAPIGRYLRIPHRPNPKNGKSKLSTPKTGVKTTPKVSTQDTDFNIRTTEKRISEFQKRDTKTIHFLKYT